MIARSAPSEPTGTCRVLVLGAGAIGGSIALDLVRAGQDPLVVDPWAEHVAAMVRPGLHVILHDELLEAPMRAVGIDAVATFHNPVDVVILATKAYDTRWACALVEPVLAPEGVVVGVQNGMTLAAVTAEVGAHRTIGCVPELAAEILAPGIVRRATTHERTTLRLGTIDARAEPGLQRLSSLLAAAGRVVVVDDIVGAKWSKCVLNAMMLAASAAVGLSATDATKLPGMREVCLRVGRETLAVGRAAGLRMQPIFGLSRQDVVDDDRVIERLAQAVTEEQYGGLRNCVLQDHLNRRWSEVNSVNGFVIDQGRRAGIPTPANEAIVHVSDRITAGELVPDPRNLDRILARLKR
jgi:2-dehydropantoate 2-reductase